MTDPETFWSFLEDQLCRIYPSWQSGTGCRYRLANVRQAFLAACRECAPPSQPTGDEEAIEQEIDRSPWDHLLALADLAEEQGNLTRASGYRWLAQHRKHPYLDDHGPGCKWYFDDEEHNTARTRDFLPTEIAVDRKYPSRSAAFRAAADAVGQWLLDGAGAETEIPPAVKE